jgi:predicted GNAT family N-acyltransferase
MTLITVTLNNSHKKNIFDCGNLLLNNYLHTQAKQDLKRKLSGCFILADEENTVKGYYTLSNTSIPKILLPKMVIRKLPPSYHNLPATLIGRLAVDKVFKGQRLGEGLLLDAMYRSLMSSKSIGSMSVIVEPIDIDAELFYSKYGFIALSGSGKMFLPMETISRVF